MSLAHPLPHVQVKDSPMCVCGTPGRCLCSCQFPREPLFVLCEKCFSKHQKILANHNYLEIAAYDFVHSMEDLAELRKRNIYRNEMKESLRKIESCRTQLAAAVDALIQGAKDYKAKVFAKLDECVEKVNDGVALIDRMQYTSVEQFQFPYRNVAFTYELNVEHLMHEVEGLCTFDIDDVGGERLRKKEEDGDMNFVKTEVDGKLKEDGCLPQSKPRPIFAVKRKSGSIVRLPKKKGRPLDPVLPKLEEDQSARQEDCLVVNFTP